MPPNNSTISIHSSLVGSRQPNSLQALFAACHVAYSGDSVPVIPVKVYHSFFENNSVQIY
jgi:hypothetical protein